MKILQKSLEIASALFPIRYKNRESYEFFHYSFAWERNKLLAIGTNNQNYESPKALQFAKRFNVKNFKKYPYLHSEVDMLSRLFGRYYVDGRLKVVNLRLNRWSELKMARPCESCQKIFNALDVDKIWYSDDNGDIVSI